MESNKSKFNQFADETGLTGEKRRFFNELFGDEMIDLSVEAMFKLHMATARALSIAARVKDDASFQCLSAGLAEMTLACMTALDLVEHVSQMADIMYYNLPRPLEPNPPRACE